MSLEDDIFRIEEGFWLSGEAHFLEHVDEECLLILPQAGEMQGIQSREAVAATATSDNRWRDLAMSNRSLLAPTDDLVLISYRADVTRVDGQPYAALIGSGYVRRASGWKLAFHQHALL